MDKYVDLSCRILTDLLLTLANAELVLESLRIDICVIQDFAVHAAFRKIDRQGVGYLTAFDLFRFIRSFTTEVDEEDCRRVVEFFDTDGNGALCLQE